MEVHTALLSNGQLWTRDLLILASSKSRQSAGKGYLAGKPWLKVASEDLALATPAQLPGMAQ